MLALFAMKTSWSLAVWLAGEEQAWATIVAGFFAYGLYGFLWVGKNWARWLLMIGCGISIVSPSMPMPTDFRRTLLLLDVLLSACLLYWINTKSVRGYFGSLKDG